MQKLYVKHFVLKAEIHNIYVFIRFHLFLNVRVQKRVDFSVVIKNALVSAHSHI